MYFMSPQLCPMVHLDHRVEPTNTNLRDPEKPTAELNRQQVTERKIPSSVQKIDIATESHNQVKLHEDWSKSILSASERISFKKFTVNYAGNSNSQWDPGHVASFWFAVEETLHSADYIQSQESNVVAFWATVANERVNRHQHCNVLDIGSNGGYFSLLSRSIGCNVLAVDAQPWCLTRLSSAAAVNGFTTGISTRWAAVSDDPNLTIEVGATKCSGLWAVKESEWINKESTSSVTVKSATSHDIVSSWIGDTDVITLLKIDAEGSELSIIKSALPLFEAHRILHLVGEFVPGRVKAISSYSDICETFEKLYSFGYKCSTTFDDNHESRAVSLSHLRDMFNPSVRKVGSHLPEMWRCSLSSPSIEN